MSTFTLCFCQINKFVEMHKFLKLTSKIHSFFLKLKYTYLCKYICFKIFSSIYPLAGFLALINNMFEIRGDALKLCIVYQRPFGERVANIGVWKITMECMGVIVIIVNFALIGQCGQIKTWFPNMDETYIIILIVGIEHLFLLSKLRNFKHA